jgi:hypothetical protein
MPIPMEAKNPNISAWAFLYYCNARISVSLICARTGEIVDEPEHYLYSSARDYAGIKGLLDIEFIE